MPSVEGGGVEKNFFIISNYLANKLNKVLLITAENNLSKKINNIEVVYPKSNFWRNKGRFRKYIICVFLLIKILLKNRNIFVFTFQANLYAILVCKLFRIKVISRSNSSPSGWSKNFIKNYIYKVGLNLADTIIVNSIEFILTGSSFLTAQGAESLKYLFASNEKLTTIFRYSFKFCIFIKLINVDTLFCKLFKSFLSTSFKFIFFGILLLQFFFKKEKTR